MKTVLFVCTANAGRSQIAEAFFNALSGGKARAISAGVSPVEQIHQKIIDVMDEVGIDIGHQKPRLLTPEMLEQADLVITMGCEAKNACPATFTKTRDWDIEDTKGQTLEKIRQIRDEIRTRVDKLLAEI